jgi:Ca2+-binding RTX toxin-like protein
MQYIHLAQNKSKNYIDETGVSYIGDIKEATLRLELDQQVLIASDIVTWKATDDSPEYTSAYRNIYTGLLTFNGSQLKSIRIDKVISWTSFNDWGQNIISISEIPGGFEIADATSKAQWASFQAALKDKAVSIFSYDDVNWNLDSQTPPTNTTTVEEFLALPEGKYFAAGWSTDPTGTNILPDISLEVTTQDNSTKVQKTDVDLGEAITGISDKTDAIAGSAATDVLVAGKGADKITGGDSADQFVFNIRDAFGKKGADTITDFNPSQGDKLVLSPDALPGLSDPALTNATSKKDLKAAQKSGASLIYYQPLGQLFYDQNGKGKGFGSGGLFAILAGAPSLTIDHLGLLG